MRDPLVRRLVRQRERHDPGWPHAPHLERPARRVPGRLRRQDRPHLQRRLEPGRRGAGERRHDLRDDSRQPFPLDPERRPRGAARLGHVALRGRSTRPSRAGLRPRSRDLWRGFRAGGRRATAPTGRSHRPPARAAGRPFRRMGRSSPVKRGDTCSATCVSTSAGPADRAGDPARGSRGSRRAERGRASEVVHVPHRRPHQGVVLPDHHGDDERGARPDADRPQTSSLASATGRAAGWHSRVARGSTSRERSSGSTSPSSRLGSPEGERAPQIRCGADAGGDPQRLRRRSEDQSRSSTAVVDPTGGSYTEINEWVHTSSRTSCTS